MVTDMVRCVPGKGRGVFGKLSPCLPSFPERDLLIQFYFFLEEEHAGRVNSLQRGAWLPLVFAGCVGVSFLLSFMEGSSNCMPLVRTERDPRLLSGDSCPFCLSVLSSKFSNFVPNSSHFL